MSRRIRLGKWIKMIQWEATAFAEPAFCTLWHPEVTVEMVQPLVRGKVIEITADTVEDAVSQLPDDIKV